ncbi:MAG: glycoside hydrolase family 3 C-terminal domain-containing protein [Prevotella sp.]|jgi:beta-glucosidase|nr:glycoside hydrolase family 3 C-terminal domain-containing protein [Prevotella sp.]MCH4185674.1 glycoside hydrolase family 3 C-terminal domain-containing protein [Prevotella sp.]MCH4250857.1 glycoside hydrolase family 3 C-terminal domain-containing protein [Prevotella sp.]MCI1685969.1 glycoside hydrolase family 3 C-terminal domain-containing protein [Prevotella sp.]MCI1781764.1 glycoside hydrolase family 3 C-terminal domain-containing protein [Prevotella sp.]
MKKKNLLLTTLSLLAITVSAQSPQLGKSSLDQFIKAMTLDEKIDLLVGSQGNMSTQATATIGNSAKLVAGAAGQMNGIPRLGIPATVVADGPAGLRIDATRQGTSQKFYCTHFPVATVMSSTWNPQLVYKVGEAMGNEVLRYGVDILLAPATNIQRNPLDGRNFEYYSEDPLLAGTVCAAMIKGVQSNGVGTSLKHFALNNQETNRTSNNVIGSPRTFREIYLKPFEIAVKTAQPWTVMTSYNKINGTMTSERSDLITNILRREWGFKGMVMTDWYGGQHVTLQMEAGNDLLMPGKKSQRDDIKKAVLNGRLSMDIIDRNVRHILELILRTPRFKGYVADNQPDLKAHAVLTRQAAQEGMVLLKNTRNTLPLHSKIKNIAVFGRTSYDFIAGGTGSGNVNHAYVVSLIDGLKNGGLSIDPSVQKCYEDYISKTPASKPASDNPLAAFLPKHLIPEMTINAPNLHRAAKDNDAAIITIGKTSGEFADRSIKNNFNLTQEEKGMIADVCSAFHQQGKKVIVVLNVCGVIETSSWISEPDAVLVAWLPGQEGGNSVTDILTGKESPSGRLPMTWPKSYTDVPSKADFPNPDEISEDQLLESLKGFANVRTEGSRKNFDYTTYNDGIYVGYRYYTTKNIPVSFPFGYGLSYTTFKYSQLAVIKDSQGDLEVKVNVTNKGKKSGKEVVEVYVAAPGKDMDKPSRELRGFTKTRNLAPGESETVSIAIPYSSLASFNEKDSQWQVEAGNYTVEVARNAADKSPLSTRIIECAGVTEKVTPSLLPEQK